MTQYTQHLRHATTFRSSPIECLCVWCVCIGFGARMGHMATFSRVRRTNTNAPCSRLPLIPRHGNMGISFSFVWTCVQFICLERMVSSRDLNGPHVQCTYMCRFTSVVTSNYESTFEMCVQLIIIQRLWLNNYHVYWNHSCCYGHRTAPSAGCEFEGCRSRYLYPIALARIPWNTIYHETNSILLIGLDPDLFTVYE